jgi:hypothetical protein
MGGFDVKPGATRAVDFARANTPEAVPGKRTNIYDTGEPWIDQGGHGHCHGRAEQPSCFLEDDQRDALIADFQRLVEKACTNYKLALQAIRVDQLISRDSDLNWLLSLALDLAGAQILGALTRTIGKAVGPMLSEARTAAAPRTLAGRGAGMTFETSWRTRAEDMLAKVTPQKIEAVTKAGFDPAKAAAKAQLAESLGNAHEKAHTLSYIDELSNNCDIAFDRYALDASAQANDAELVVMWHGMKPVFHSVGAYKEALAAKIERYKKSGVPEIGERTRSYGQGKLSSETRIVYVRDIHGHKVPWYEKKVSDIHDRGQISTGEPQLDRPVPEEFRQVAVERSELRWGAASTIDDGFVQQLKATGQDVDEIRRNILISQPAAPQVAELRTLPPRSVFAREHTPLYAPGSVFDLDAARQRKRAP